MKKLLFIGLSIYFTGFATIATCSKIKNSKCLVKSIEVKKSFK